MTETSSPRGSTITPDRPYGWRALLTCLALLYTALPYAATPQSIDDLKALSIAELLDVHVTSVSRRPQKASNAAAALFVITREDIRRSGLSSVPELLRMVPGVQVARIDASKWAVSARGFNGRYSNKLLVQKDGRTLYSPLYSGVYWDVQDTPLDDIERIEIIRGPGATLWGANAVNGVINIITRPAHATDGGLLTVDVGTQERDATLRHGGALGDSGSYRVYAKGFERDQGRFFSGKRAHDDWRNHQFGFRADIDLDDIDTLTLQGDLYDGSAGATIVEGQTERTVDSDTSGGNLLLRWTRQFDDDTGIELQTYVDYTDRRNWSLDVRRSTYDIDLQHYFSLGARHNLIWGAGLRHTRDHIHPIHGGVLTFDPQRREDTTFSGFIQDEITVVDDVLQLIVGSKIEHNDYTGWELQPNIRGLWNIDQHTTAWAAISRAVRTPSRVESDVIIRTPFAVAMGDDDVDSERLTAVELGLRIRPAANLSFDLATFYNRYDDLFTVEQTGLPGPPPARFSFDNLMDAESYGIELAANWDLSTDWRMKLAYTGYTIDLDLRDASTDVEAERDNDRTPHHQLTLRSLFDLRHDLEFDTHLYYVDTPSHTDVSSYVRLDARLGWRVSRDLDLSLSGHNLLDSAHPEFVEFSGDADNQGLRSTQAERAILLQAKWRF